MKVSIHVRLKFVPAYLSVVVFFSLCFRELNSLQEYTSKNGVLTHLLVDNAGQVFVGGENAVMRFSPELVLKETVSTQESSNCPEKVCEEALEDNFVSIFIFHPYANERFIMFCGTIKYGSCTLFNTSKLSDNISLGHWNPESSDHYLGSKSSALAVIVPGYAQEIQIFSAMDYDGRARKKFPKVFSVRKVSEQHNELSYRDSNSDIYITLKGNTPIFDFKYGFHYKSYTYFLRNTKDRPPQGQISEVCSKDVGFRSYVESDIGCDDYVHIESVYLLENDDTATLYAAFSSSKHGGSVVCEYQMDALREAFNKIQSDCYFRRIGFFPGWISGEGTACSEEKSKTTDFTCGRESINKRIRSAFDIKMDRIGYDDRIMTSLIAAMEENTTVLYCGFEDGTVTKFLKIGSELISLYTIHATHGSKVNDKMVYNPTSRSLYLTYGDTVAMLKTDDCSLHSSCITCLSDTPLCQWCPGATPNSKCIGSDDQSCTTSKQDYCEPEIHKVNPVSGPLAGGTVMTLQGQFGYPSESLYHVSVGSVCIINETRSNRIICVTSAVSSVADNDIQLTVTYTGKETQARLVPVFGNVTYRNKYLFRDPNVSSVEPNRISSSGRPLMVITGADLDIGSLHQCHLSGSVCDVDSKKQTEVVVAMKDENRSIGKANLDFSIDLDNSTATIEIIEPPEILALEPSRSIQAGGITLTLRGSRLDGMGKLIEAYFLSDRPYIANLSMCHIDNETTMFCPSPPVENRKLPITVRLRLRNKFEPVHLGDSVDTTLRVVSDPVIINFTETLLISEERTVIKIKGNNLSNVEVDEIKVAAGPVPCLVSGVTDEEITCLLKIPSDIHFDNEFLQVQIGNILRLVGNIVYHKERLTQEPPEYSLAGGTNLGFILIALIGGIVVLIVTVVLGMKRLKLGPFKGQRAEEFSVVFRNGGSDVLTLDGLSENHATDISQNRQNAYQEQTFLKPSADDSHDACTEPLLPGVDEDLKLTLERQNLLVGRDTIILGEILGQGHFGCVYKGYLQNPGEKGEQVVAAKTLHRKNPKELDINMFLKEALIMKDFQHCHVMKLIGICIGQDQLPLVILPYMEHGDLLSYLRDPKNLPTVKDLVTFGVDIANGMCYLAELKFVHRDLAARNCMMDDNYRVKVADFGLSRDVYEKEYYSSCDKTTKLPVKWMAPESLEFGMYTSRSDVWSFGVVLWELLTRGVNPYPEVDNWDILKYLKTGRRMSQPSFCPEEMFLIMQRCWSWESADRPSFGELTVEIPALIRQLEHPAGERGSKINIETTYVNFMADTRNN